MKNFKIVKRLSALTLAGAMIVAMVSCSKSKDEDFSVETAQNQQDEMIETHEKESVTESVVENKTEEKTTEKESEKESNKESETEKKEESKIKVYSPLDFKTVSDYATTFDSLIKEREDYEKQMKNVLNFKLLYSKEDISTAIYNVVRIDSDLSSLILKVYENKQNDIQNMVYLADQIETLEAVLNKMQDLQQKIETSKSEYSSSLNDLTNADANQIEKVHKYALNPLKAPIKQLVREIDDLKAELQESLGK